MCLDCGVVFGYSDLGVHCVQFPITSSNQVTISNHSSASQEWGQRRCAVHGKLGIRWELRVPGAEGLRWKSTDKVFWGRGAEMSRPETRYTSEVFRKFMGRGVEDAPTAELSSGLARRRTCDEQVQISVTKVGAHTRHRGSVYASRAYPQWGLMLNRQGDPYPNQVPVLCRLGVFVSPC